MNDSNFRSKCRMAQVFRIMNNNVTDITNTCKRFFFFDKHERARVKILACENTILLNIILIFKI